MGESLAEALLKNGCAVTPYSTNAGQPFGQQPAGFICEGHGVRALGSTPERAAKNWLDESSRSQNAPAPTNPMGDGDE
jgi:hypothetical protein